MTRPDGQPNLDPKVEAQYAHWTAAGVSEGIARRARELGTIPDRGPGSRSMRRRLQTQAKMEKAARQADNPGVFIPRITR